MPACPFLPVRVVDVGLPVVVAQTLVETVDGDLAAHVHRKQDGREAGARLNSFPNHVVLPSPRFVHVPVVLEVVESKLRWEDARASPESRPSVRIPLSDVP